MNGILNILAILIFPSGIFLLLNGLAYEWVDRKMLARLQNRVGPRWFQPVADVIKLLVKEEVLPRDANHTLFILLPIIAVAGPLTAVLPLRARALDGGLVDAELAVATTSTDELLVACAHCAAVTSAPTHVGGIVACTGCGRRLVVHHHVSRRQGTFLGFQVDAEQWEGA